MTREEAIKGLKNVSTMFTGYKPNEEMFAMAIKALEQQPCDDCISRQAVLDIVMSYCQDDDGSVENTGDLRNALDDIESLPSVTPKEKTGHWIDITNKNGTVIAVRCNCCGNSPKHAIRSEFCPNCGVKMIEPRESEVNNG